MAGPPTLTRFKDRNGYDGPVSGAVQIISVHMDGATTNVAFRHDIDLPVGMQFNVTDIVAKARSVVGDPSLTIGTTTAATSLVAAVNLTTGLGALTLKAAGQHMAAGGILRIIVTNDTTADTFRDLSLTIVGHVSVPPTSMVTRSGDSY